MIKPKFFQIFTLIVLVSEALYSQVIVAHRGGSGKDLQESSVPAFSRSLSQNAKVLESDLHLTKDNKVVLYHDPYLFGDKTLVLSRLNLSEAIQITKAKNFDLFTLDRMAEFLTGQNRTVRLEFEIKFNMPYHLPDSFYKSESETVEVILETLNHLGLLDKVTLSSFNQDI